MSGDSGMEDSPSQDENMDAQNAGTNTPEGWVKTLGWVLGDSVGILCFRYHQKRWVGVGCWFGDN